MNEDMQAKPEDFERDVMQLLGQVTSGRVEALAGLKDLYAARQALLEHETLRLRRKLSDADPRVRQLEELMALNRVFANDLEGEIEMATAQPVQVTPDQALVEGRIVDEKQRGIEKLVVTLEDANGKPLHKLGQAETGKAGYYALRIDHAELEKMSKAAQGRIFVAVRTSDGTLLDRTPEPVSLQPGERFNLSATFKRSEVSTTRHGSTPTSDVGTTGGKRNPR